MNYAKDNKNGEENHDIYQKDEKKPKKN